MVKSTSFVGVIASDIASCVVKLVADPVAVLFLFASGFLIYSHLYLESGLIKSLVALLLANNATKVIGTWLILILISFWDFLHLSLLSSLLVLVVVLYLVL